MFNNIKNRKRLNFRLLFISIIILFGFYSFISAQPRIIIDPNEYLFELPHGSTESGVLNVENIGDTTLIVEVTQRQPHRDLTVNILIWTRFVDQIWRLPNILSSINELNLPYRIREFNGTDADSLFEQLSRAHILLIPEQVGVPAGQLFNIGAEWREVLQDWVINYRGYIVAMDYAGGVARFLNGAGLMSIRINSVYQSVECEAVGLHPVNAGILRYVALRSSNLHFCNDEGAIAVTRGINEPGANITAKRIGTGGIVYIGMNWMQFNQEMTTLLNNSIMWFQGGWTWLLLDHFNGVIESNHSEDLFFTIETRLISTPGNYLREIILLTNDPTSPEVCVPVEVEVTSWQPAKFTVTPPELFIISPIDTFAVVLIHNEGPGTLRATVSLTDTNQTWVTSNRREITLNPNFQDRILLRFYPNNAENWLICNILELNYQNPDSQIFNIPILFYKGDEFGSVCGKVTDRTTGTPISNATVNLQGLRDFTDEQGEFQIDQVPPASYRLNVKHPDYLPYQSPFFNVTEDDTTTVNTSLEWCDLTLTIENPLFMVIPPNQITTINAQLFNPGSGILNYNTKFYDREVVRRLNPWQTILRISRGGAVQTDYLYGIAFDGENIILSGLRQVDQTPMLWKLNRLGELVDSLVQPGAHPMGMSDLAWDGNLIWGSDTHYLIGVNRDGQIAQRIPIPLTYALAVAYASDIDQFWIANGQRDIYRLDRAGRVQQRIINENLHIFGLAYQEWEEEGFRVWMFCQDGPDEAQINQLNPETEQIRYVCDLFTNESEYGGGCEITVDWEPRQWTMLTQFAGTNGRTAVYYLAERLKWAQLEPPNATVQPNNSIPLQLKLDARGFRENTQLNGYITIEGGQRGGTDTLFINAIVSTNSVQNDVSVQPKDAFISAYPNPTNDFLFLTYQVPFNTPYSIEIFDIRGRLIDRLSKGKGTGARETCFLTTENLPSGIYFIALHTNRQTHWLRAVLLK